MTKKKIYRIPCEWKMCGILEIEAENLEEAKRLAIEEYPLYLKMTIMLRIVLN